MTAGRPSPDGPQPRSDDAAPGKADDAKTRAAKGAAQEAIGKLIGDDAARQRGAAQKAAAHADDAAEKGTDAADAANEPGTENSRTQHL